MHSVNKVKRRLSGNISLTTIIMVGAILIVSGMAVLSNAIDIAMSTKSFYNRSMADIRIATCIDEGMYKLTKQATFTGTVSVTYTDGNCQVVIGNVVGDATKKNLLVTATYGNFTVTRTKKADITTSPISLSN